MPRVKFRTREAGVEVVDESWCEGPVVLQARIVRLEYLVPNALRNERLRETRKAAFDAGQFAKCVTEVERLTISQVVRDLRYVVVGFRRRLRRSGEIPEHSALGRQWKEV